MQLHAHSRRVSIRFRASFKRMSVALEMAFSAEPGRKTAYSDDLRWRIVWQRIAQEKSYRDIAKNLNISVGTVHNIWQKFEATGDISKEVPRERERERVLDEYHEILILGVLAVHPDMYLSELCIYIHSSTGTLVSNSTISRVLKRHGYTRKKIQHIALQRCEDLRAQFVAEVLCFFSLDKFVWIDECGCSHSDALHKVGYALRGMTPTCTQLLTRKRRISCIAAMSSDGIVAVKQTQQTVDSSVNLFMGVSYPTYSHLMEQTPIQSLLWTIVQYIV